MPRKSKKSSSKIAASNKLAKIVGAVKLPKSFNEKKERESHYGSLRKKYDL